MHVRDLASLTKIWIAAASTLSTATGYLAASNSWQPKLLSATLGTFLLAMGACALNEWQEREIDGRMARTRHRPLPAGSLRPLTALAIAAGLVAAGTSLLAAFHRPVTPLLGLAAVLWYNGVYTHLKRLTAFAVVPGAVIGALPPVIGWTAGGGSALDPRILALAFFFFVWQVPHFWLLLFMHGGEYSAAGLPTLTAVLTAAQLRRLTVVWTLITAGSVLLLPLYALATSTAGRLFSPLVSLWLVVVAQRLMRAPETVDSYRAAFHGINLGALVVMGLLAVEALAR
jgi:heme o synthase